MHRKRLDGYEGLCSIRISPSRRRAAIVYVERAETIIDTIFKIGRALREAGAGIARLFGSREPATT